ncbi:hypothetical protein [Kitasatospora purpeofusca]|uniref:hypothetical protein n=1 Tax=Kitasatospora purpeofusca TaxID=67352 RepID=UPI0038647495
MPEVEDLVPFYAFHRNVKYAIAHATLHRTDGVPIPAATITNPPTGYVYFSLLAEEGFSGVTVTSRY